MSQSFTGDDDHIHAPGDIERGAPLIVRDQGIGRHGVDQIADLGMQSLEALSALLGNRRWLMGEAPCGTDAAMTGMLAMLFSTLDFDLRRRALALGNLTAYTDRAMAHFFPEHAWQRVSAKSESPALAFA